jgi:RNA polymerase primary sigma factor
MATTTTSARRRQHQARRTTTVSSHARPHQTSGARGKRGQTTVVSAPAPEVEKIEPVVTKVVRAVRAPDSDDHLAAYFRQLAEHALLSPEDERELSQGIEDTEILTWERVLSRPEIVKHILSLVQPNLEQPISFPKLDKAIEDLLVSKKARKDPKLVKKLVTCAKEYAPQLRLLDLDRVHIDAVVRELYRARSAALAGEQTWWDDGATKDAGQFVDEVRQAHRDAANLRDEFVRANLRLVVTMARRYDRGGMPLADLIQEGNLGLMHAV